MQSSVRKSCFTKGFPDKLTDADVERFHFEGKHPYGLSNARDMGKLLEMIATNKAASEKSCKEMLRLMGHQQMRTRIPRFLSDDVDTPHKTGDFPPYIANDIGFIETPMLAWWWCSSRRTIAAITANWKTPLDA